MSTVAEQPATQRTVTIKEQVITYVPLGETESISLTLSRVKQFLCVPTRSGKMPTDEQVVKYMMLCKAQSLNPWVNDAYLVGYDTKDGPQFSLITAHQSFLKRAEASPEFNGIESGVVVFRNDNISERQGDLVLPGETLMGAWARVHRRDRQIPSYDALNLKTFDTGRSRWAADPAGMIVKCAEASALRKAFPSTLAAMYCREEMEHQRESRDAIPQVEFNSKAERLAGRLLPDTTMSGPVFATSEVRQPAEEPQRTSTVAEQNDKQHQAAQQVTPQSYMDLIADCKSDADIKTIIDELNAMQTTGPLLFDECVQLIEMANSRRNSLK